MKEIAATSFMKMPMGPIPIKFPEGVDEFVYHLHEVLRVQLSPKTISYQQHNPTTEEPYYYFGYSAEADGVSSEIVFQPVDDGILAYVGLTNDEDKQGQLHLWIDIVTAAVEKVITGQPEYEWFAIIGPVGDSRTTQLLAESSTVGEITVSKSTTPYSEVTPSHVPGIRSWAVSTSYPVFVEGVSNGYNWLVSSRSATERLNLLCALLSVALGADWRVRQAPEMGSSSNREIPRYNHLLEKSMMLLENGDDSRDDGVVIPDWCADAWHRVLNDDDLRAAVHAYHQGLEIEKSSPSFALIAYVGVVEGLGKHMEEVTRCESCGNVTQSARRFRKALKKVLSNREVKELVDVYDRRSRTAHEGKLFADESMAGAISYPGMFMPTSDSQAFRYDIVWKMQAAARKLLAYYLEGRE